VDRPSNVRLFAMHERCGVVDERIADGQRLLVRVVGMLTKLIG